VVSVNSNCLFVLYPKHLNHASTFEGYSPYVMAKLSNAADMNALTTLLRPL